MQAATTSTTSREYDPLQLAQDASDRYNATEGSRHLVDGIVCELCKNRGLISRIDGTNERLHECECMPRRRTWRAMERSGLADLIQRYTLDNFTANTPWHARMRQKAETFLADRSAWFFVGGQAGCGKTHICTAVCAELLNKGCDVRYMLWRDESTRLKAMVNDDAGYHREISRWKDAEVLYIDDLFKIKRQDGAIAPTDADVRLAFEILNYRYNDLKKRTIISSEWMSDELMACDEGVGSRIYERSRACCVEISRDPSKNYRTAARPAESKGAQNARL